MVEYEKFTNEYVPHNHTEKLVYFPVTTFPGDQIKLFTVEIKNFKPNCDGLRPSLYVALQSNLIQTNLIQGPTSN